MFIARIYDRGGTPLAELTGIQGLKLSFGLNKYGDASFSMGTRNLKATRELLSGNRIVIFNDLGVEPWGGWIAPVREWKGFTIVPTCQQVGFELNERRVIRQFTAQNKLPHEIFGQVINMANAREHTGIVTGEMFLGGATTTINDNHVSPYKLLEHLSNITDTDWDIRYVQPAIYEANLYERKGEDKRDTVQLIWGKDIIGEPDYSEDEIKLGNYCFAVGVETEGQPRPEVEFWDDASIYENGLAEFTIAPDGVSQPETLMRHAVAAVNERKRYKKTVKLSINNSRGAFAQFTEGDIITVYIPEYGFGGLKDAVRVLGRTIDADTETMEIAAEVVAEDVITS
jgi:hypothetical protein